MAHPCGAHRFGEHHLDGIRQSAGIPGRHQHRDIKGELREVPDRGGHERRPARHRLQGRQAEALVCGGQHDRCGLPVERREVVVVDSPAEHHAHLTPPRFGGEAVGFGAECAGQRQQRTPTGKALHRLDQRVEPLARIVRTQAADPQDEGLVEPQSLRGPGVAKLRAGREDGSHPVRHDVDTGRVEAERRD